MDAYEVHKRIAEILRTDQAAGQLADLSAYQARFPEHEDIITAAFHAMVAPASAPDVSPTPVELTAQHRHHYTTVAEIARGGMGAIFHVRDETLHRDLAMKVVLGPTGEGSWSSADGRPPLVRRFLEEAQITAQLDHPGVVPVYELGADKDGRVFFTMKLVKGRTLGEVVEMARSGEPAWPRNRVLRVFVRVLETLAFAHEKGVIHRDLKPANVMVGDFGEVYVMDWGLAKVALRDASLPREPLTTERTLESQDPRLSMAGHVLGTPCYMAPEQGRQEDLDGRADVYAVGAMLYEFLSGTHPYSRTGDVASVPQVLVDLLKGPPQPLRELQPDLEPELVAIVTKSMTRDPAHRYPTALGFARDLTSFMEGRVVEAHRTGTWVELRKWVARNRALSAALAAAFLLLLGGFVTATALGLRASLMGERAATESRASRRQAARANLAVAVAELDREDVHAVRLCLARVPPDLRGWAWRHLNSHLDESLLVLDGISHAFEPTGNRLLVLERSGAVRSWDLDGHASDVILDTRVASDQAWLDPGGTHLLQAIREAADRSRWTVRVRSLQAPSSPREFSLQSDTFAEVNWSQEFGTSGWRQSTNMPWFCWSDHDLVLTLRNIETGEELKPDTPPRAQVRGVSPDGRLLLLDGMEEREVLVFDTETRSTVFRRPCRSGTRVLSAAWSPDASRIVMGGVDRIVRLLDAATGTSVGWGQAEGHTEVVTAVAVRPDGQMMASAGLDQLILLRDLETGAPRAVYHGHEHPVNSLSFSPDSRYLASTSSGGRIRIWSAAGDEPFVLRGHASYVYAIAFSPDGQRIYSGGWDGYVDAPGHLRVWDAASGDPIAAIGGPDRCTLSVALTADGTRLFTTGGERATRWLGGSVCEWDATTGRLLRRHPGRFRRLALSPDARRVAATDPTGTVTVLDLDTGAALATLAGFDVDFSETAAAWSPEGRWLAGSDVDATTFSIWDAQTFDRVRTFRGHTRSIRSLEFSSDGTRILSASDDRTARVWDVETGRELAVLEGHGADVLAATFSADRSRLFTGGRDGNVRVWDTSGHEQIVRLGRHDSYVSAVVGSPDGETIVSGGGDKTVRIWDARPLRDRHRERGVRRELVAELTPHVKGLFDALETPEQVIEALHDDSDLEGRRLEIALQVALSLAVSKNVPR